MCIGKLLSWTLRSWNDLGPIISNQCDLVHIRSRGMRGNFGSDETVFIAPRRHPETKAGYEDQNPGGGCHERDR